MAKNRVMTIQAPYGGINRRTAFQQVPPFTCYDAVNFLSFDANSGRITTATRPPLVPFGNAVTEVNMASQASGVRAGYPDKSFVVAQAGQIKIWDGSAFQNATGAQAAAVDTGSYVSATPFIDKVIICDSTLAPIVLDYTTGIAITIVASAGAVPTAATIATQWQGALWLAEGNVVYGSRVGDYTDYDYGVSLDDRFGAFFTDGDYKGNIAGPITALMPQTSDTMLVSTVSGTLAMRGHPRQGGVFEAVGSPYVLGQGAWTQAPNSHIIMMTAQGMMSIGPEPGAVMAQVSRDKIPDELVGLPYATSNPLINLQYDTRWNGIWVTVRGGSAQGWWFDMNTGGFHRMTYAQYPFTTLEFLDFLGNEQSGVILGRTDGAHLYDISGDIPPVGAIETFTSELTVGPLKISPSMFHAGKIKRLALAFVPGTVAATGTMKIATGVDGADAVNRMVGGEHQYSTTITELNTNYGVCYPDLAGHAAVIEFTLSAGGFALEEMVIEVQPMGNLSMVRDAPPATPL